MCSGFLQHCLKLFFCLVLSPALSLVTNRATAQDLKFQKKLSPELDRELHQGRGEEMILVRVYLKQNMLLDSVPFAPYHHQVVASGHSFTVLQMELRASALARELLPLGQVVFVEKARKPVPELSIGSMDLSMNGIRLTQERFPSWKGEGRVVSVKEDKPDTADLDIRGRFVHSAFASSLVNTHATLMSTIIAGAGNSWYLGRGAAPAAEISPADFSTLLPEPDTYYQSGGISVQNHSYGVGIENYYGADAAMYDASAWSVPNLLHVFSAGNRGNGAPQTGPYQNLGGFANLTGSFKMAKNALTVGAVDSFRQIEALSSRGPAHDGRIKPELVAFGEDGSSGAAALVSGAALLLQQSYRHKRGTEAPNALIRAVLLNSADDLGTPYVDYVYGFGNLNAHRAMQAIEGERYHTGVISSFHENITEIKVSPGTSKLKMTLAWNDPPAAPNTGRALVHDLDLELRHKTTGQAWLPWVLSSFPHTDSLRRPAVRGRDSLNNAEQVTIDFPDSGVYEIRVRAGSLLEQQVYFLSWQQDTTGSFEWLHPLCGDPMIAGASNLLRWNSNISSSSGTLEYSTDQGNSWTLVRNDIDLQQGSFRWTSPQVTGPLLLRMNTGTSSISTDTLVMSLPIEPVVGYSCTDSFYLYWHPVPGAQSYRVFAMGTRYLKTQRETTDTMAVLAHADYPANYVAVEPVFSGLAGQRSFTFNYTAQGVGCYIRTFLGLLDNDESRLFLSLGTQYQVQRIILEKWNGSDYITLEGRPASGSLEFLFNDKLLQFGVNRYRIRLEITGGRMVYSLPEDIFYAGKTGYRLYPNPIRRGEPLQLFVADLPDDGVIQIYDLMGRMVGQQKILSSPQALSTIGIRSGTYVIRVVSGDKIIWIGKFVVL